MAPKKKTKRDKLANMSEEEKLRYLQHKATMEEEAHRRKQQIIATYMNMKLKHEELFSRLNSAKINQQWRHILRKIKCEKLKEDISNLEEHYEEVFNHKNELISRFLSDLDRAEFQYSLQFQEHMETISKFLRIHEERLQSLHSWYTSQLEDVRDKNVHRTLTMLETIEKDFENIETSRRVAKQEHLKKLKKAESVFSDRKNDLQTKLLYRSVKVEEKYADELGQLQQEYHAILEQYKSNTDSKLAHYRILSQKDNANSSNIVHNYQTIEDGLKRIEEKKNQLENLRLRYRNEESNLNSRKDELAAELQHLRQQYEQNCKIDQRQLKFLVNSSNAVFKDLNSIAKKGNQILPLMNHCLKLTKENKNEILRQEYTPEIGDNIFSSLHKRLHIFWKTRNSVTIANEMLVKTRLKAQEENGKLRKLLRYHISSLHRSQSVPRKYGF